jgi:hypothetical protein
MSDYARAFTTTAATLGRRITMRNNVKEIISRLDGHLLEGNYCEYVKTLRIFTGYGLEMSVNIGRDVFGRDRYSDRNGNINWKIHEAICDIVKGK